MYMVMVDDIIYVGLSHVGNLRTNVPVGVGIICCTLDWWPYLPCGEGADDQHDPSEKEIRCFAGTVWVLVEEGVPGSAGETRIGIVVEYWAGREVDFGEIV